MSNSNTIYEQSSVERETFVADLSEDSKIRQLHALQSAVRAAWRLLIVNADDGGNLLDLPVGQVRCLRRIMENEGCKLIDLARETNLSLPNASRLVDRLVQRGFVMRETDPSDRRAVRLHVSGEARGMIERIDEKRFEHMRRMTNQLSIQQIDSTLEQLEIAIAAAQRAQASAGHALSIENDEDMIGLEVEH